MLREHLSLIVALFTILFTLQVYFIIDRTIDIYEQTLRDNYSMVLVSEEDLKTDLVKSQFKLVEKFDPVDPQKVIERLKDELNKEDLGVLRENLPKFYRVFLNIYPTPDELKILKIQLEKIDGVVRVETYSKTHDQIFKLLILFKEISNVFLLAIFLVSALLVIKEMRIWQFEHVERMNIMALFGAPLWMRSAVLFKVAVIDAFISSVLVVVSFIILDLNGWLHELFSMISIDVDIFEFFEDTVNLLSISILISLVLAIVTILQNKDKNNY